MRLSDRSEAEIDNDAMVETIATAMLTRGKDAVHAWHHAGVTTANHLIKHHPEKVADELAEAETEWNTPGRIGQRWLALLAGYRETLLEYTQRGDD